jgi:hypothetical protein
VTINENVHVELRLLEGKLMQFRKILYFQYLEFHRCRRQIVCIWGKKTECKRKKVKMLKLLPFYVNCKILNWTAKIVDTYGNQNYHTQKIIRPVLGHMYVQ